MIAQGNYAGAIIECDKTLAKNPDYADAWWSKAVTLEYLGNHNEALADQNKAGQIDSKYLSKSLPDTTSPGSASS